MENVKRRKRVFLHLNKNIKQNQPSVTTEKRYILVEYTLYAMKTRVENDKTDLFILTEKVSNINEGYNLRFNKNYIQNIKTK